MRPEDILERVRARPFQPFFVHLSDGTQHLVPHPEMILVMERQLFIAEPTAGDRVPRESVRIDPKRVTHLSEASPEHRQASP